MSPPTEIDDAARLLASAWLHDDRPGDPKGGFLGTVAGNPEWHKDTGRWLKRYIAAHGRPNFYPWTDRAFDYLVPDVAAATLNALEAGQGRSCGPHDCPNDPAFEHDNYFGCIPKDFSPRTGRSKTHRQHRAPRLGDGPMDYRYLWNGGCDAGDSEE